MIPNTLLLRSRLIWDAETGGSYVTHYSYFGSFRSDVSNVGPYSAMLTQSGKLTDIGSWYLGGVKTGNKPKGAASRTLVSAGTIFFVGLVSLWCWL